jgi:dihydrofolate reductase
MPVISAFFMKAGTLRRRTAGPQAPKNAVPGNPPPPTLACRPGITSVAAMRVTLVAAQSVDGFITKHGEPGTAFTSAADQAHFRRALGQFDCGLMGGETYRVARDVIRSRRGPNRLRVVLTRRPEAFAADAEPGVLEFTQGPPAEILQHLERRGHRACALLGGAQIHALFLAARLVDELWLTLEPCLFGTGTPLVGAPLDAQLRLLGSERLDGSDSLLLRYSLNR